MRSVTSPDRPAVKRLSSTRKSDRPGIVAFATGEATTHEQEVRARSMSIGRSDSLRIRTRAKTRSLACTGPIRSSPGSTLHSGLPPSAPQASNVKDDPKTARAVVLDTPLALVARSGTPFRALAGRDRGTIPECRLALGPIGGMEVGPLMGSTLLRGGGGQEFFPGSVGPSGGVPLSRGSPRCTFRDSRGRRGRGCSIARGEEVQVDAKGFLRLRATHGAGGSGLSPGRVRCRGSAPRRPRAWGLLLRKSREVLRTCRLGPPRAPCERGDGRASVKHDSLTQGSRRLAGRPREREVGGEPNPRFASGYKEQKCAGGCLECSWHVQASPDERVLRPSAWSSFDDPFPPLRSDPPHLVRRVRSRVRSRLGVSRSTTHDCRLFSGPDRRMYPRVLSLQLRFHVHGEDVRLSGGYCRCESDGPMSRRRKLAALL